LTAKDFPNKPTNRKAARAITPASFLLLLCFLLVGIGILSLFLGRYPQPGLISLQRVREDELAQRVMLNLRAPRILAAIMLGMSLGAAGGVFQMIFSNPLVEPGFLGVSQGATFGAALAIIFLGGAAWITQTSAAIFAFGGLAISYFLSRRVRFGGWVLRLVLAGIAVSALFSSGVGILKFIADPLEELPEITFWLLGGLYKVGWDDLRILLPVVIICLLILFQMRWRLNILSLEDDVAFSLGVAPGRERALVLAASVTAAAGVTAVSGIVGWVGLIVPHISRRLFGADSRYSLPGAMLLGGIFTLLCDDLARTIMVSEIPLGVLTSLFGALFFMLLMVSRGIRVEK
jgi:iron complex transport system permease protein